MLAIVQFDCAATPLVERLLDEGRLPALAELRARGHWRPLDLPAEQFPASTYHTLYSGERLADQGQHYAFQWRPEHQRLDYRTSFRTPTTIWERAAAAGLNPLVIDPYESHPPEGPTGTVLSGWQFENVISLERWSRPQSAQRELARLFGRSPLLQEVFGRPTPRYLLGVRRRLIEAPDRVASAAEHLLAQGGHDMAWITLLSSHLAGHMFWNVDAVDFRGDEGARRLLAATLADVYAACDAAIGRIVRALPPDSDLIVLSPLGMGPESSRVDILPAMLGAVLSGRPAEPGGGGLLWRLRNTVPVEARAVVARVTGRRLTQKLTSRLSIAGTDWSSTRAFMLPSDHYGQIRFNVRGRDRDGIVDPADVGTLADEIIAGLESFREADGTQSIARVWRTDDVLPGAPARDRLPDLVVQFAAKPLPPHGSSRSPAFGEVSRDGWGTGRSGGHTNDAWALLVPGPSRLRDVARPGVIDIAATACALLGLPAGEVAGEPLLERAPTPAPVGA